MRRKRESAGSIGRLTIGRLKVIWCQHSTALLKGLSRLDRPADNIFEKVEKTYKCSRDHDCPRPKVPSRPKRPPPGRHRLLAGWHGKVGRNDPNASKLVFDSVTSV
jgi:hypothetical protein